jgi:LysR family hydrogen peroxide-inducible transcriptional activator
MELRYLVAVAETRHFGRAAERFGVSQSTLSMAVRKLEENLGVLLFERSKSGIRTTQIGAQIIAQAQQVLAHTNAISALVQADQDQLGGELKLGAIHSLAPYLLPQLIPQLRLLAASLRLSIYEGYTADLGSKLRSGELDAILVSLPFSEMDVVTQELYREPLMVVMPPNHALAAKRQIAPQDLLGQTFIQLQTGHCLREQVLHICPQLQGSSQIIESSSLETLRHMIAIGLGVSILPSSATASSAYAAQSMVARPLQSATVRTIALAWRASFPRHKAIDVVRRAVQTCSWQFTTAHGNLGSGLLVENQSW